MRVPLFALGILLLVGCGGESSGTTAGTTTSTTTGGSGGESTTSAMGGDAGSGGATGGTAGSTMTGGTGGATGTGGGGTGGVMLPCGPEDVDDDGDGASEAEGDCNDCDPLVGPGAIEIIGGDAPVDDDCNGIVDDAPMPCDSGLVLDDADPVHGAAAIGLCQMATGKAPGIVGVKYTRANGATGALPLQWGIAQKFGTNVAPTEGDRMLVLSSGHARDADDPDACGSKSCTSNFGAVNVAGFPQTVPGCPAPSTSIRDDVALDLQLRVPTNATGYAFDFRFFTFDYPEWVCTNSMDQFVAIAVPAPAGAVGGGLIMDGQQRPPCAASSYMLVCNGCLLGTGDLAGTGFDSWDDAGATPWLTTTVPATAGSLLSLRFTVWDTSDTASDSTAVVDNFRWLTDPGVTLVTQ